MSWFSFWQNLWSRIPGIGVGDSDAVSNQSARFSFEKKYSKILGDIYRPVIKVKMWSDLDQQWQSVSMLVDTGADYTLLPRYTAVLLGLDLKKGHKHKTEGVGGTLEAVLIENVKVRVGPFERVVPVGVVRAKIPPLMGRHLFFETFRTTFEGREQVVFWEE